MAQDAKRFGRGAIPFASTLVLLCILATSWITYDRVNELLETKDWVSHTWRVKASVESLYGTVVTAESDVRAYVLSGDETSYDRFRKSKKIVDGQIAQTRALTQDNPRQGPNLDFLQTTVDRRYAIMRRAVETRTASGLQATIALFTIGKAKGQGIRAMDDVRAHITQLDAEEDRLLGTRLAKNRSQTIQAEFAFLISVVISVVLISAFGWLSGRTVALRDAAADEERALRNDLEREVERTRAAETRLEGAMVELRRSNEELQNFAFVASHDLQEPLRKIRAFSDRVRRRSGANLDEESQDSLRRVEAAADRMQRLILDLLELSRITTKSRPHLRIETSQAIDEVVDDLQTRLEETNGKVLHEQLPAVVVDPAQLRQLLQNLIANALKFRREGVEPEVRIEAKPRPDGRIEFAFHDNGIGFEAKYADRIFIVFQRLHGRGEYEGSGIGLAIVRKIVERHGGTIVAEGRPGEGATFRFDLPGEAASPPSEAILFAARTE